MPLPVDHLDGIGAWCGSSGRSGVRARSHVMVLVPVVRGGDEEYACHDTANATANEALRSSPSPDHERGTDEGARANTTDRGRRPAGWPR